MKRRGGMRGCKVFPACARMHRTDACQVDVHPVFPACARMHRSTTTSASPTACIPRVRADAPVNCSTMSGWQAYSPRARGCTGELGDEVGMAGVFPACARMHRRRCAGRPSGKHGIPRARGCTVCSTPAGICTTYSPRARGCTERIVLSAVPGIVFPACARMHRSARARSAGRGCSRVRADAPTADYMQKTQEMYSPRARGCTEQGDECHFLGDVFPACARMHRCRARGRPRKCRYSPRARGCTALGLRVVSGGVVFPACARMHRRSRPPGAACHSILRVRADAPT